jgi:hypothetical protein
MAVMAIVGSPRCCGPRARAHELDRRRQAAERLWRDWWALDSDLSLLDELGHGSGRVWPKATEKEAERPGQGKKYLAGAIQRATRGEIKATDILAGLRRQPDTSSSM